MHPARGRGPAARLFQGCGLGSPRLPYRNHQGRTPPPKKIHPPDPRRGRAWQQPGPRGTGPGLRNAPRGRGSAVSRSPSALRWLHGSQRRGVRREETPGSQGQPTASPPPCSKPPRPGCGRGFGPLSPAFKWQEGCPEPLGGKAGGQRGLQGSLLASGAGGNA